MEKLLILTTLIFAASPAYGYIDPGSGSAIFSAVVGALVATGLFFKTYWFKIKGLLTGKKSPADSSED